MSGPQPSPRTGRLSRQPAPSALLLLLLLPLLYAIPTVVFLHPLWARFGDHIVGRSGDPVFNLYVLKWGVHQLRLGLPDLWDANFFYPLRGTLAFSDHLIGPALQLLVLLDLRLVPNAIAGYNLLLASSFALSGATTCWVLRQGGRSWTAAALGGAMYAFAPVRWAHLEHLQVLLVQWLPLTLWCWDRLLIAATWKRAAAFLALYLLHIAGGSYLAFMIHLPLLALLASRAAADWRRLVAWPSMRVLAAAALTAGAAAWLLYSPYAEVSRRYGLERSPQEVALYAATLASYLAPSEHNLYAPWWHCLADPAHLEPSSDESRLFAGFVATGFGAFGLIAFARRRRAPGPPEAPGPPPPRPLAPGQRIVLAALLLLAAGSFLAGDVRTLRADPADDAWNAPALGFALGLGLWLLARCRWAGTGWLPWTGMDPWERGIALAGVASFLLSFPLVFVPLRHVIPGLAQLRAPGRFYVITSFAIVLFAAKGLDACLPVAGPRRRAAATALALVLAVELAPAAVALRPLLAEPDFPAVYEALRPPAQVHAVLELPRLKPGREALYMYYSTRHWRPLANGYSGYLPASDEELRQRIPQLPDHQGFQLLRERGITHLVLHLAGPDGRQLRRALPDWERELPAGEVEKVFDDGPNRIYRLLPKRHQPPAASPQQLPPPAAESPPMSASGRARDEVAGQLRAARLHSGQ